MPYIICLDPGHGGADPGAVGAGGLQEKDVALAIAKKAEAMLDEQHDVVMTRCGDRTLQLTDRANLANSAAADLFVSVHCNGFDQPTAHGVEVFHFPASTDGERLAHSIQDQLVQLLEERDRGVKSARFLVLRRTQMPAVLVELPFITTPASEKRFRDDEYLERCAEAVAAGVILFTGG